MSRTAGIIIIGDELLNGNAIDTNSPFLCKRFHSLGILVCKVTTIPDRIDAIKTEVELFSKSFDIVITTGGVGPTHDDVTYEGVALAFNVPVAKDKQFEKFYRTYLKSNNDPSSKKLITIPQTANVIIANFEHPLEGNFNYFPVVNIRNVFCLPGIPFYVQSIFNALEAKYFQNSSTMFFSRVIYLTVDEIYIVTILNDLVQHFEEKVTFGSYPLVGDSRTGPAVTKITVQSTFLTDCLDAEKLVISKIPPQWVTYPKVHVPDFTFIQRLRRIETELSDVLNTSYQIIEECLNQYDINETFISFNGGKDCTVLLNLVYFYCMEKKLTSLPKLLYFKEVDSFQEVDAFVENIGTDYGMDVCIYPMPMRESLRQFLTREKNKKACFIGLRNTDPKTQNLKPIQETDSDWPKVVRISPILHWSYRNVWDFLRCANIPYCTLYNQGYSSLGNKNNTSPNPALQFVSEDGSVYYRPAFLLEDKFERKGRCTNKENEHVS